MDEQKMLPRSRGGKEMIGTGPAEDTDEHCARQESPRADRAAQNGRLQNAACLSLLNTLFTTTTLFVATGGVAALAAFAVLYVGHLPALGAEIRAVALEGGSTGSVGSGGVGSGFGLRSSWIRHDGGFEKRRPRGP